MERTQLLSVEIILYYPVSPKQLRANRRIPPSVNFFPFFSSNLRMGIPIHLCVISLTPALRRWWARDWRRICCQPTGPMTRTMSHGNRRRGDRIVRSPRRGRSCRRQLVAWWRHEKVGWWEIKYHYPCSLYPIWKPMMSHITWYDPDLARPHDIIGDIIYDVMLQIAPILPLVATLFTSEPTSFPHIRSYLFIVITDRFSHWHDHDYSWLLIPLWHTMLTYMFSPCLFIIFYF